MTIKMEKKSIWRSVSSWIHYKEHEEDNNNEKEKEHLQA